MVYVPDGLRIVVGGVATCQTTGITSKTYTPTGQIIGISGSADIVKIADYAIPSQSVRLGGSATYSKSKQVDSSGQVIKISGFVSTTKSMVYQPDGQILLASGSAQINKSKIVVSSGQIIKISSAATFNIGKEFASTGQKIRLFSNTTTPTIAKSYSASGTIIVSGTLSVSKTMIYNPTGEIILLSGAPLYYITTSDLAPSPFFPTGTLGYGRFVIVGEERVKENNQVFGSTTIKRIKTVVKK
jgi:hypothetical protein